MKPGTFGEAPSRRELLKIASACAVCAMLPAAVAAAKAQRLVLVHGRDQQGRDPAILKSEWVGALKRGAAAAGLSLLDSIVVTMPFYGDKLESFVRQYNIPLTSDVHARGGNVDDDFLDFQSQVADELRQRAGVTDAQVDAEYGSNPRPRGPLNWEWVQAILRALDKHGGGVNQRTLDLFTRDVYLYTTRDAVRDEIDQIVAGALTEEPTVVVGHSLGSVVAYNVLRSDHRALHVPLYVTVGSPLGVRAIREKLPHPLRFPSAGAWFNAFDRRDVVALYPLDEANFPVKPIENYDLVKNHTDNRHGIDGYLDDSVVAKQVLGSLVS